MYRASNARDDFKRTINRKNCLGYFSLIRGDQSIFPLGVPRCLAQPQRKYLHVQVAVYGIIGTFAHAIVISNLPTKYLYLRCEAQQNESTPLSKRKFCLLVVNFESLCSKKESFWAMLEYCELDIVLAS